MPFNYRSYLGKRRAPGPSLPISLKRRRNGGAVTSGSGVGMGSTNYRYVRSRGTVRQRVADMERMLNYTTKCRGLTNQLMQTTNTGPVTLLCNGIALGNGQQARAGYHVASGRLTLSFKALVDHENTTVSVRPNHTYRCMVIVDKIHNGGGGINLSSIFGTSTPSVHSLYDMVNGGWKNEYDILYDKAFTFPPQTASYDSTAGVTRQGNISRLHRINLDLRKYKIVYQGSDNTAASISDNAVFFVVFSDVGASERVDFTVDSNYWFIDP